MKSIGILSEELEELKKKICHRSGKKMGEEEVNENIKNKKEEMKKNGKIDMIN